MNVQRIYEQHKLEAKPEYHVISGFDIRVKQWKFMGYRCNICEQTLKTPYVATKHQCLSAKLKKDPESYLDEVKVITTEGKPWKKIQL
jgi:hypothetical protein